MTEIPKKMLWLEGPNFLLEDSSSWNFANSLEFSPGDHDPEVKKSLSVHASRIINAKTYLLSYFENMSSWQRMVRVMAMVLKFVDRLRLQNVDSPALCVENITSAERVLLKMIQVNYLPDYYNINSEKTESRTSNKLRRASSCLWNLDPYRDQNGVVRVGGRLRKLSLEPGITNPIIVPKDGVITCRIIEYYHNKIEHAGRTSTLNELRQQGLWIISANTIVRSVIHHCVPCKLLRGELGEQKMADLPQERATPEGPFTVTWVDMFGPF